MEKKNVHEGHRARMREDFRVRGFSGWQDHQVLEYLLQWCKPRVDTNETAHDLINACGGFANVFKADKKQLTGVYKVGENTAEYIHMLGEFLHYYNSVRFNTNRYVLDIDSVMEYMLDLFDGAEREYCYMICLNKRREVLHCTNICEGGFDSMDIDVSKIIHMAVKSDASYIVLAHNHPSGIAKPSDSDIVTTRTISNVLSPAGIKVWDHIIVAGGKCVSIRSEIGDWDDSGLIYTKEN